MPVFSRIKIWVSSEVLTAADLNAEINNLLNNTIPASIEDYSTDVSQMQSTVDPGGSGTESLATTLAGELQRLRYMIKFITGAAQWYIHTGRNLGTGNLSVQTADIATGAVTFAKLASPNKVISSSSTGGGFSSTSFTDITNLSCSITTTGGKVKIYIIPDNDGVQKSSIGWSRSNTSMSIDLQILRDSTVVAIRTFSTAIGGATSVSSAVWDDLLTEDAPSAGTYTYKLQGALVTTTNSASGSVSQAKLVVEEIKA